MKFNPKDFETTLSSIFNGINRLTLFRYKDRLRFALAGESGSPEQRLERALSRIEVIFNECFGGQSLWVRITLWDDQAKEGLLNAGLDFSLVDNWFEGIYDHEQVLYIHIEKFKLEKVYPIINAILNYELGFEPASNITCYFISFNIPLILNIYDDRGLDILTFNKKLLSNLQDIKLK